MIQEVRKKLSVGASESDEFVGRTVVVQGSKIDDVVKIITETFKVPFKYIKTEDKEKTKEKKDKVKGK